MNEFKIYENITDDELRSIFEQIKAKQQNISYINQYYENINNSYEIRLFLTSTGKYFAAEVFQKRNPIQEEIDGAYYFINKGYPIIFLSEAGEGQHPDALINGVLVEFKTVKSGIANSISNRVKQAVNKENTEIPVIFLIEEGLKVKYQDILESIKKRILLKNFKKEFVIALFIKNEKVTVIKKYAR